MLLINPLMLLIRVCRHTGIGGKPLLDAKLVQTIFSDIDIFLKLHEDSFLPRAHTNSHRLNFYFTRITLHVWTDLDCFHVFFFICGCCCCFLFVCFSLRLLNLVWFMDILVHQVWRRRRELVVMKLENFSFQLLRF
jgi:hypothetical protein